MVEDHRIKTSRGLRLQRAKPQTQPFNGSVAAGSQSAGKIGRVSVDDGGIEQRRLCAHFSWHISDYSMDPNVTPITRRRGRGALSELSRQFARGVLVQPTTPGQNTTVIETEIHHTTPITAANMPSSLVSPAPSPDEMVIRLRGRKKTPLTWSPESDAGIHRLTRQEATPTKNNTSVRSVLGLRTSPRKRLQMSETKDVTQLTPKKASPNNKRQRLEPKLSNNTAPLETVLKGLSHAQLINVIQRLAVQHPNLKDEIYESLPQPDLIAVEDELNYLKKNIFKSLPTNRLTSKTDSPAYSRAATHLLAFKRAIVENGKRLLDSQHWETTLHYVVLAWSYVRATPMWDNAPHNNVRKQCFKALASYAVQALRKAPLELEYRKELKERFEDFASDSDDMQACLKLLNTLGMTVTP